MNIKKTALSLLKPEIEKWLRERAIQVPGDIRARLHKKGVTEDCIQLVEAEIEEYAVAQVGKILDKA
jgi:hypothetical protein